MTRQQKRAAKRAQTWNEWKCVLDGQGRIVSGPKDEHGIMPRKARRGIALTLAKR